MKNALAFGILVFAVLIVIAIETIMALWKRLLIVAFACALLAVSIHFAFAHDSGQWENTDPVIRQWFKWLMQPDNPTVPCCGEADAYWADSFEMTDRGEYIAIVTDDRDDVPLRREHIPVGTRIVVPSGKIKWDQSNPTGHGVLFVRQYFHGETVYCFCPPGGV